MAEMYSVPTQTTTVFAETNDTPAENALTKTAECLSNGWVSDWWFWKRGCWARGFSFFFFFYRVSRDVTALLRLPFALGRMLLRRFTCILRLRWIPWNHCVSRALKLAGNCCVEGSNWNANRKFMSRISNKMPDTEKNSVLSVWYCN